MKGGSSGKDLKRGGPGREGELLDPSAVIPRGTPAPPIESVLRLLADVFMPKRSSSLHEEDAWRYYMMPAQDAWWYYMDVYYKKFRRGLEELDFRAFVLRIWQYVDAGNFGTADAAGFADRFIKETRRIPCAGVVILNSSLDEILLVQGTWSNAKWAFPKGKLKEGEAVIEGAIREVEEEIGVNVRPFIVEGVASRQEISGREITLFLAVGLSTQAKCTPQTRREIADIRWHRLRDIHDNARQYPLLIPFLDIIDGWIDKLQEMLDIPQDPDPPSSSPSSQGPSADQPLQLVPDPGYNVLCAVPPQPAPPPGYNVVFVHQQQPPPPQPAVAIPFGYAAVPPPMIIVPQQQQQQQQPQQIVYVTPQPPVAVAPWWPPQ